MPQHDATRSPPSAGSMRLVFLFSFQLQLLIDQQANERDSLGVGMNFLDASLSGYLEVTEVPDLTAKLFNLLDVKHKGRISHENLQECVNSLCARLDTFQTRIQRLQVSNSNGDCDFLPVCHFDHEAHRVRCHTSSLLSLRWRMRISPPRRVRMRYTLVRRIWMSCAVSSRSPPSFSPPCARFGASSIRPSCRTSSRASPTPLDS